jgi:hypothetical protein
LNKERKPVFVEDCLRFTIFEERNFPDTLLATELYNQNRTFAEFRQKLLNIIEHPAPENFKTSSHIDLKIFRLNDSYYDGLWKPSGILLTTSNPNHPTAALENLIPRLLDNT